MELPDYAYCAACDKIRRADFTKFGGTDVSGQYRGGDLLCSIYGYVIATLYEPTARVIKVKLPA